MLLAHVQKLQRKILVCSFIRCVIQLKTMYPLLSKKSVRWVIHLLSLPVIAMVNFMTWNLLISKHFAIRITCYVLSSHMGSHCLIQPAWNDAMAWWDTCIEAHAAVGVKYMVQPSIGGTAYRN